MKLEQYFPSHVDNVKAKANGFTRLVDLDCRYKTKYLKHNNGWQVYSDIFENWINLFDEKSIDKLNKSYEKII